MYAGQVLLSIYTCFATFVYLVLICKLFQWRRTIPAFKSSYYSLFILQFIADLYAIFVIEVILRPRKFNYFGLAEYVEHMQSFATFSYSTIISIKTSTACGRIVIALNRFTAFYSPLRHEEIWSKTRVYTSVFLLWFFSAIITIVVTLKCADAPYFFWVDTNVLHLRGGVLDFYGYYQSLLVNATTVIVSTMSYAYCYMKIHKLKSKHTELEKRLLFCAVASCFPCVFEMARTIFVLIHGETREMYILMSAIWYYETVTTTTLSLWLQLILNNDVRNRMFRIIFKPTPPPHVTNVVTNAFEYRSTQKSHWRMKSYAFEYHSTKKPH